MKAFVCMFTVFVSACSLAAEVHALPAAAFADTEVSTNFAFAVGAAANRRLVFTLELQASPSNPLKLASPCGWTERGEWILHG